MQAGRGWSHNPRLPIELVNGDWSGHSPLVSPAEGAPCIGKVRKSRVQGEHGGDVASEHGVIHPQDAEHLEVPRLTVMTFIF